MSGDLERFVEALRDSLDDGEIPGAAIEWQGQQVWVHTSEQIDRWLRNQLAKIGIVEEAR